MNKRKTISMKKRMPGEKKIMITDFRIISDWQIHKKIEDRSTFIELDLNLSSDTETD